MRIPYIFFHCLNHEWETKEYPHSIIACKDTLRTIRTTDHDSNQLVKPLLNLNAPSKEDGYTSATQKYHVVYQKLRIFEPNF